MIKNNLFGADLTDAFEADPVLDPELQPATEMTRGQGKPLHLFLTGATGFTGAYILRELLRHTRATIHCLVRCSTPAQGLARVRANLEAYSLWDESQAGRIKIVPGTLTRPRFDLSQTEFEALAGQVEAVYHNGASVKLVAPYYQLRGTNVNGTREVLRLAMAVKTKPTHIVSTVSVFDFLKYGTTIPIYENDEPGPWKTLRYGYEQSKCVAEMLVRQARSRGLPLSIYRPGRISGDSRSGASNHSDLFSTFMRTSIHFRCAPKVKRIIDMTPVDYVAAGLVRISLQNENLGKNYHLVNSRPMYIHDLISCVRGFGYVIEEIALNEWQSELAAQPHALQIKVMGELAQLFDSVSREYLESFPVFDASDALAALSGTGIRCPPVDEELLRTYFTYFVRSGFIEPPASPHYFNKGSTGPEEGAGRVPGKVL